MKSLGAIILIFSLATPALADSASPYVGNWAFAGDNCKNNRLVISETSVEDEHDLFCEWVDIKPSSSQSFVAALTCVGSDSEYEMVALTVTQDELIIYDWIDFGTGTDSTWHRCTDPEP